MEIDVIIEDARWEALGLEPLADRAGEAVAARLALPGGLEVALLAADDDRIAGLNAQFRSKARPTNVLSWPSEDRAPETPGIAPRPPDEGEELGDIALAWETIAQEAADQGKPIEAHTTHLIVHGLLHLLGYDHETEACAHLMEGLETEILATLGLPDPY